MFIQLMLSLMVSCVAVFNVAQALPSVVTVIAGGGKDNTTASGIAATSAAIGGIGSIVADTNGNIFLTDIKSSVLKVNAAKILTAYAGSRIASGYQGDNGQATSALMKYPYGLALLANGDLYVTEYTNCVIRKIAANGIITTAAGQSGQCSTANGNEGVGTSATLKNPLGIAYNSFENSLYVSDLSGIRILSLNNQIISAFATGISFSAYYLYFDPIRNLYASNIYVSNSTINKFSSGSSSGTTFAGTSGLQSPGPIAGDTSGMIYIGDDATAKKVLACSSSTLCTTIDVSLDSSLTGLFVTTSNAMYVSSSKKVYLVTPSYPTQSPTLSPTRSPTLSPTGIPTLPPTRSPTAVPSRAPTFVPTQAPTRLPTALPTLKPTSTPTFRQTTSTIKDQSFRVEVTQVSVSLNYHSSFSFLTGLCDIYAWCLLGFDWYH